MTIDERIAQERDRYRQIEQGQREQAEADNPANRWPYTDGRLVCTKCGLTVRIDRHKC